VTKSGYGISGRYENIDAEFGTETGSKIADAEVFTVGLAKYINGNNLKIQTDYTQVRYPTGLKTHTAELLVQIIF
jgi:phosphate-selective porin